MDRSVLEGKDRDELITIATSLGAKPASRTKKADLVSLILEQVGGNGHGDPTPDAKTEASTPDGTEPATAASPESSTDPSEGARDSAADGDDADKGGDRSDGGSQGQGGQQRDQGGGGRQQAQGGKGGDQQRNQGGQGQGGKGGDDRDGIRTAVAEPGNRRGRRRRRGKGGAPEREQEVYTGEPIEFSGLLDLRDEGYGFVRTKGFMPSADDYYLSVRQVRQFGLRKGDLVEGKGRPALQNEKNPAVLELTKVNGDSIEDAKKRVRFEDLTPLFPDEKLRLESDDPANMTARIIDLISPIGKGQRGLIVSPPKAGKTTIMKQIAQSIEKNNPEVHLMILLVDERPEEVTDMRRTVVKAEVVASTFDRPSDEHTAVAELTIERAKRLVEMGKDVVIVLDGITRLSRAYNLAAPATGRIMSGGVDSGALYPPKKFFGAARNLEEGGSLTILATALIETGSKMDEVIFEEFKGTGNMELRLDRRLAERRIYPAIDVDASSTRHEELLFDRKQLQQVWKLRRVLSGLSNDGSSGAGLELLTDRMKTFKSNDEFLAEIAKAAPGAA